MRRQAPRGGRRHVLEPRAHRRAGVPVHGAHEPRGAHVRGHAEALVHRGRRRGPCLCSHLAEPLELRVAGGQLLLDLAVLQRAGGLPLADAGRLPQRPRLRHRGRAEHFERVLPGAGRVGLEALRVHGHPHEQPVGELPDERARGQRASAQGIQLSDHGLLERVEPLGLPQVREALDARGRRRGVEVLGDHPGEDAGVQLLAPGAPRGLGGDEARVGEELVMLLLGDRLVHVQDMPDLVHGPLVPEGGHEGLVVRREGEQGDGGGSHVVRVERGPAEERHVLRESKPRGDRLEEGGKQARGDGPHEVGHYCGRRDGRVPLLWVHLLHGPLEVLREALDAAVLGDPPAEAVAAQGHEGRDDPAAGEGLLEAVGHPGGA
mmetsp:Transcript_23240/g.78089  ORF Transcript_23240/g.78089 Transcript_23240/m.78089 type:complete len:377 (-) Transcript_23240:97-1227(-)